MIDATMPIMLGILLAPFLAAAVFDPFGLLDDGGGGRYRPDWRL